MTFNHLPYSDSLCILSESYGTSVCIFQGEDREGARQRARFRDLTENNEKLIVIHSGHRVVPGISLLA